MPGGRRGDIRMSPDEIDAFLASRGSVVVGTIGRTGQPHLVTMLYGMLNGNLAFQTYGTSQKIVNLRRDPRITCLVEDPGGGYGEIRGVQLLGQAEIVEDFESVLAIARCAMAQWRRWDSVPVQPTAQVLAKRVGVIVHPERAVSWDHRRLNSAY